MTENTVSDFVEESSLYRYIRENKHDLLLKSIRDGADIEQTSPLTGHTPLIHACQHNNLQAVKILLEHGADPSSESIDVTIFKAWREKSNDYLLSIGGFLIDERTLPLTLSLSSFVYSVDTPLFSKIFEKIDSIGFQCNGTRIEFRRSEFALIEVEVKPFYYKLLYLKPREFREFLYRFSDVVEFWACECSISDVFSDYSNLTEEFALNVLENLDFLFESEFLSEDDLESLRDEELWIALIVEKLNKFNISLEKITKFILNLLSYGFIDYIDVNDLVVVYNHYRHCDLFKFLLFMDVNAFYAPLSIRISRSAQVNWQYRIRDTFIPLPIIIIDHSFTSVDKILETFHGYPQITTLLEYFTDDTLTRHCLELKNANIKLPRSHPRVASLLELSRNALRASIVSIYKPRNSCQFYTRVNSFGGGAAVFKIMSFESKLYSIN